MPGAPAPPGDDWYRSEQPTRLGMITELQRIRRRMRVRPIPVLLLATVITTGIMYKIATKPVLLECEVVLALTEGSLANQETGLPVDQLRAYVASVLLPDNKLSELIEKRDLFRLRKKLGPEFAVEQLRESLDISIWKNSFEFDEDQDENAARSARIGLTVTDSDPDRGFEIARDLAGILIETLAAQRQKLADELSGQIAALRQALLEQRQQIESDVSRKQAAIDAANQHGRTSLAGILRLDLLALDSERLRLDDQLLQIATSRDSLASEIAEARLDMSLQIVKEHRPERPTRSTFVLILIAVVVGTGALIGAALVLGAFDSRIHDSDDVARLGLPVLGHVPGFAGDKVGSMQTRSVVRPHVPSFLRWRSHR